MQFVILQSDTYIAYLLMLCQSPQIILELWYATILGLHGGDEQWGRSGEAGQGKMKAAWLDQCPRAPDLHSTLTLCICHSALQCTASSITASATTAATMGAQLFEAFVRGMSERWLLETALLYPNYIVKTALLH